MARISKCDKLTEHERLRLVGRIGEGTPWETLEAEFHIAFSSIREWANRNGYRRSPTSAKRKLVEDSLAKPETANDTASEDAQTVTLAGSTGNADADAAAQEDVRDMRLGIQCARLALKVSALGLKAMHDSQQFDYKEAKGWSECVAINVNTIRKIRGLDDTTATANITIANPRSFD